VVYSDNLTDIDLTDLFQFHRLRRSPFTMVLFHSDEPRECGIALCGSDSCVVAFEEKPASPKSRWANGGIYVAGPSLFGEIPPKQSCDFGLDVLPRMVGRMYGYPFTGFYRDTGTSERLERARQDWARTPT
jgi:mannose-1-phosphate guanylyltransferase